MRRAPQVRRQRSLGCWSSEGSEEESPAGTEAETPGSREGSEGSDEEEESPARTETETRLTEGLSGVGGGGESC